LTAVKASSGLQETRSLRRSSLRRRLVFSSEVSEEFESSCVKTGSASLGFVKFAIVAANEKAGAEAAFACDAEAVDVGSFFSTTTLYFA